MASPSAVADAPRSPISALVRDIATYGFGDLLLKATSFITLPIYTRLFTAADFGKLNYVATSVGLVAAVLSLGADSAYARHYFEARDVTERRLVTSTWLIFLSLWAVGCTLLLLPGSALASVYSFGNRTDAVLFVLALLALPLTMINSLLGQVLRNEFRVKLFTALNVFSTLAVIVFSLIAATVYDMGVKGILFGTLIAGLLQLPARLYTARNMIRPVFSSAKLKTLLAFGIPLVPASLAYWIFGTSDRIIIGKMSTLSEVGYYSVASSLTSVLALAYGAFGQAWSPHAIRSYEADPQAARVLYGRVLTLTLAGFGLIAVVLTAFAREAITIVATEEYSRAALAVGPLCLGYMAYASTQITAGAISMTKKTHYFAIFSWCAAILNIVGNILFVPRWGMVAASWTTAAAYLFLTVAYGVTSHRLWPIVYERMNVIVISVTAFAIVALLPAADLLPFGASVAVKTAACLAFAAFTYFFVAHLPKRRLAV